MPAPVPLSAGSCSGSGSRLLVYVGCKRPLGLLPTTGKRVPSVLQRQQQLQLQRRLGHSWVSGHPHSMLYKPSTANNKTYAAGNSGSASGSVVNGSYIIKSGSNGGNSALSSFLDFAGNSRYQAYNLARFSTFSAASSSSSSSSTPTAPSKDDQGADASTSIHADRARSNPASTDAQSPQLSSTEASTTTPHSTHSFSSSPATPSESSATPTKGQHDDKEDDWAVNESYSGHGGHGFTSSPSSSSTTTTPISDSSSDTLSSSSSISHSVPRIPDSGLDVDGDTDTSYESRTALQPSLSSFQSPSAIEASWRRTSESLPAVTTLSGTSVLPTNTTNKAGGLDLSSSTLVQQMLFRDRTPHADSSENEGSGWKQLEGNSQSGDPRKSDEDSNDDWDDLDHSSERKRSHG
ncbi:hypothetical protein EDD21DRAFT_379155 [Dissophora ornata]|nr:hypothetical protein EDD21DRAFT_379155 [Dissophora ornata]